MNVVGEERVIAPEKLRRLLLGGRSGRRERAGVHRLRLLQQRGRLCLFFNMYINQSTATNWTAYPRGGVRLDNRQSSVPGNLCYRQGQSGTHTMSASHSFSVNASLKLEILTVSATAGVSTTETHSWTSNNQADICVPVPAGKVGYIYSYNAAVDLSGNVLYDKYQCIDVCDPWSGCYSLPGIYMGPTTLPISASVPTNGYYSFVTVIE